MVDGYTFGVEREFRYLGVLLDEHASIRSMMADIIRRAHIAFARLCEYVGTMGWTSPWTRLVIYDVFVRATMTFAAPVWAPPGLRRPLPYEDPYLRGLFVLYR